MTFTTRRAAAVPAPLAASTPALAQGRARHAAPPDARRDVLRAVEDDPEGSFVAVGEEGTDDLAHSMNAAGTLGALARADAAVGVIRAFVDGRDDTPMRMAGDPDAGGPQVPSGFEAPEGEPVAATTEGGGIFMGQDDVAGGILVRAAGPNADRVPPLMDGADVRGPMRDTTFGQPSQRGAARAPAGRPSGDGCRGVRGPA